MSFIEKDTYGIEDIQSLIEIQAEKIHTMNLRMQGLLMINRRLKSQKMCLHLQMPMGVLLSMV